MLILKIKDKGFYLEIPGAPPVRTPAEIDITKCDLSVVSAHLRMNGIKDYQIISGIIQTKREPKKIKIKEIKNIDNDNMNKRFQKLEDMMEKLLTRELVNNDSKKEQNINKFPEKNTSSEKLSSKKDPELEDLDDQFIPNIDTSGMKMKSSSKKIMKQNVDLDDSADLLSRIMGQEDG